MEIANCRWCGNPAQIERDGDYVCVVSKCKHWLQGPSFHTIDEAVSMWNEMMGSSVPVTLETASTDYRDRIDRMAAAILGGYYANPNFDNPDYVYIAKYAIRQIDAIDAAIGENKCLRNYSQNFFQSIL